LLFLIGSIILTSYLILSFKVVERFRIPVFQAIVFNYITCVVTGLVVNQSFPFTTSSVKEPWFFWAGIMGCLFISLFNIIGITTQKLGVAVASVANKLSLVIPFIFSIYLYNESATWIKITGVVIALVSVVLTCWPQTKGDNKVVVKNFALYLLPAVLFFGSGLLDTLVKYVEQTYLNEHNNNAYLIASFGTAAFIGSLILVTSVISRKAKFDSRSILAGIDIGIPNYFSIWCLVNVLKEYPGNSSAVIPINNMGIVLFGSVVALILFKERLSTTNWIGIVMAVGAIALIAFG
jgi:drug/metabolite transporter (DMT)-like permease